MHTQNLTFSFLLLRHSASVSVIPVLEQGVHYKGYVTRRFRIPEYYRFNCEWTTPPSGSLIPQSPLSLLSLPARSSWIKYGANIVISYLSNLFG